jgi:FlaA1/EpsC-like NDP-sugar epimerase
VLPRAIAATGLIAAALLGPALLLWIDASRRGQPPGSPPRGPAGARQPAGCASWTARLRRRHPRRVGAPGSLEAPVGTDATSGSDGSGRDGAARRLAARLRAAARRRLPPSTGAWTWMRFSADCAAVAAANAAAFVARFDGDFPDNVLPLLVHGLPVTVGAYAVWFRALRTHRSIWRYAGVEDLGTVIRASMLGGSLHALLVYLVGWDGYPRSVLLSTIALTVLAMSAMRLVVRSTARPDGRHRPADAPARRERRRVIVIGAGDTGESLARHWRGTPAPAYDLVGFVDDHPALQGHTIHNLPVLGRTEDLPALARRHRIEQAIIAIPRLALPDLRRIAAHCAEAGLSFRSLPSASQLVCGEGKLRYLREVRLEELLPREGRRLDEARVREFLAGKCVMVTGAGGSIGSELCRQVLRLGARSLVLVERAENALYDISLELRERHPGLPTVAALADVKHVRGMHALLERHRPDVIFHAAAYKHVPMLEDHPIEAVLNNIVGTRRLTDAAGAFGVGTFVFVSTDKAASPRNLMGATKRVGELYVTAAAAGHGSMRAVVVRFGNVLGSAGSVVPLFQRQLENGQPLTITDPEVSRFFMTIPEAVGLVLQSTTLAGHAGTFILDMGQPRRIRELADDVVTALGLAPAEVGRRYVGLRPGEKLHERLWDDGEQVVPSGHERILAVQGASRPLAEVAGLVARLEDLALRGDAAALLREVQAVVPSYRPEAERRWPAVAPVVPAGQLIAP